MNNHTTIAPIAAQEAGTPKTSGTAIAPTANSGMPQRIDSFMKRHLAEARSDAFYGVKDSANRTALLGFKNSANSRYADFLAAFRNSAHLTIRYQEKYPNSTFLPWAAFRNLLKALDLWVDLPEFYLGAVPEAQMPWMEIFELEKEDAVRATEMWEITADGVPPSDQYIRGAVLGCISPEHFCFPGNGASGTGLQRYMDQRGPVLRDYWREASNSFFVVAPKEAFSSREDWISRFRKLLDENETQANTPPDDPLVIRFCHGGVLVVAAWGDEAAELNKLTNELGL